MAHLLGNRKVTLFHENCQSIYAEELGQQLGQLHTCGKILKNQMLKQFQKLSNSFKSCPWTFPGQGQFTESKISKMLIFLINYFCHLNLRLNYSCRSLLHLQSQLYFQRDYRQHNESFHRQVYMYKFLSKTNISLNYFTFFVPVNCLQLYLPILTLLVRYMQVFAYMHDGELCQSRKDVQRIHL